MLACDAYVTMKGSASGAGYPPECRGLADVTVTAYDTQGTRLDACTTDTDGTCRLAIDYNGTRIFQQDTKNVPEGYRSEGDVQRVFTYTEFAEIAFHNYREDVLPQRDAPRATVRVSSRICPDRYTGDSFFDDCNAGVPETDQWIIGSAVYARTGKDGNALLKGIAAGNNTEIIGGQGPDTGDIFFYCSLTNDPDDANSDHCRSHGAVRRDHPRLRRQDEPRSASRRDLRLVSDSATSIAASGTRR